ncbi:hypothetical protein D6821_01000 [Candidatus Parcubacteria bacterium]|nr:MAG: hypothetical protein D6821_01000 [Candidatus Parcubacteria bacterium]
MSYNNWHSSPVLVKFGYANSCGFCIEAKYGNETKAFYSLHFQEGEKKRLQFRQSPLYYAICSFVGLFLAVIFLIQYEKLVQYWQADPPLISRAISYLATLITAGIIIEIFFVVVNFPLRRWHACEHKLCHLLEFGLPPSLDYLRCLSSVHQQCGSLWIIKNLIFWGWFVFGAPWVDNLLLSLVIAFGLQEIGEVFGVCAVLQKCLFIAKPRLSELRATKELAQKVYQWTEKGEG